MAFIWNPVQEWQWTLGTLGTQTRIHNVGEKSAKRVVFQKQAKKRSPNSGRKKSKVQKTGREDYERKPSFQEYGRDLKVNGRRKNKKQGQGKDQGQTSGKSRKRHQPEFDLWNRKLKIRQQDGTGHGISVRGKSSTSLRKVSQENDRNGTNENYRKTKKYKRVPKSHHRDRNQSQLPEVSRENVQIRESCKEWARKYGPSIHQQLDLVEIRMMENQRRIEQEDLEERIIEFLVSHVNSSDYEWANGIVNQRTCRFTNSPTDVSEWPDRYWITECLTPEERQLLFQRITQRISLRNSEHEQPLENGEHEAIVLFIIWVVDGCWDFMVDCWNAIVG